MKLILYCGYAGNLSRVNIKKVIIIWAITMLKDIISVEERDVEHLSSAKKKKTIWQKVSLLINLIFEDAGNASSYIITSTKWFVSSDYI